MTPVVRVEREEGKFYFPFGVAVDYQSGNIYVSDQKSDRVQVFDGNARYLYKFGDQMNMPRSIAISENRVFVCEYDFNYVLVHDLNGTLMTQFRVVEEQSNQPFGIAISEVNGDIYVCDLNNCRIQMFCKDLPLKSQFRQEILKMLPFDIKLTNECIYVLSSKEPFLYSFTYDLLKYTALLSVLFQNT